MTDTNRLALVDMTFADRAPVRVAGDTGGCPPGLAMTPALAKAGPRLLRWAGEWAVTHLGTGRRVFGGCSTSRAVAEELAAVLGRIAPDWSGDPRGWPEPDQADIREVGRVWITWWCADHPADADLIGTLRHMFVTEPTAAAPPGAAR